MNGPSAIQKEIRQQKPFQSPAQECLIGLFRTADALKRRLAVLLEATGITIQQYNVLRILRGAAKEGLPTLDIAERMVEHAPGITRLLDRLERKGLVRRKRSEPDRRQVFCWITPGGLSLLRALDDSVHRSNEESLEVLGGAEVAELIRLMDCIRQGLASLAGDEALPDAPQTNGKSKKRGH